MEGLSLAQWNALNGFGKTCADKAAKTDRTVDLERRFRKVAKVVHVSEDEAFKQFLELKARLEPKRLSPTPLNPKRLII